MVLNIDFNETDQLRSNHKLIDKLLLDRTTGKNIRWGTNSYAQNGFNFNEEQEIKVDLITGWYEGFIRPRSEKGADEQLERTRNRAEVFTLSWVIKKQVDAVIDEFRDYPISQFLATKWLEITCGEAPYMANRYDMVTGKLNALDKRAGFMDEKFKRLNKEIEDQTLWVENAKVIFQSSYGYEYQGDSLLLARENLLLTFIDNYFYKFGASPEDTLLIEIVDIISNNVFQMDGLTYEVPYSSGETEVYQMSLFDEPEEDDTNVEPSLANIRLWDLKKDVNFIDIVEGGNVDMKFDVVIGNPPYEDRNFGDNATYAPAIYDKFMDASYVVGEKVSLITPGRFLFNAGSTSKSWNKKMLEDKHLKVLFYEENSGKIFPNTDIKGGIAITYRDRSKVYQPIDVFIPFKEMREVIEKVRSKSNGRNLSEWYYSSGVYRLTGKIKEDFPNENEAQKRGDNYEAKTNIFDVLPFAFIENKPNDNQNYIKMIGRSNNTRVLRWVKKEYIKLSENHNFYKVIVPKSNGSGKFGETLSSPQVISPGVGYTQTFISFGSFENKSEAEFLLKYIKTKFLRSLLSALKPTQHNPIHTWVLIPLQNFTSNSDIDWTKTVSEIDQQLYKKYNLSADEIKFIEENVKEMV